MRYFLSFPLCETMFHLIFWVARDISTPWGRQLHTVSCKKYFETHQFCENISNWGGYNGKYGSNPQGIREISDDLFEFYQIGQWIDDKNWEKWYFMKENFETIPRNQKSLNLTLISWSNWRSKWGVISKNWKNEINKNKTIDDRLT